MKVQVLGPGCQRCEQLHANTLQAAAACDPSLAIEVEKVSDINQFAKMGVFMTPGLVIDGNVISVGKVLTADEIKKKIEELI